MGVLHLHGAPDSSSDSGSDAREFDATNPEDLLRLQKALCYIFNTQIAPTLHTDQEKHSGVIYYVPKPYDPKAVLNENEQVPNEDNQVLNEDDIKSLFKKCDPELIKTILNQNTDRHESPTTSQALMQNLSDTQQLQAVSTLRDGLLSPRKRLYPASYKRGESSISTNLPSASSLGQDQGGQITDLIWSYTTDRLKALSETIANMFEDKKTLYLQDASDSVLKCLFQDYTNHNEYYKEQYATILQDCVASVLNFHSPNIPPNIRNVCLEKFDQLPSQIQDLMVKYLYMIPASTPPHQLTTDGFNTLTGILRLQIYSNTHHPLLQKSYLADFCKCIVKNQGMEIGAYVGMSYFNEDKKIPTNKLFPKLGQQTFAEVCIELAAHPGQAGWSMFNNSYKVADMYEKLGVEAFKKCIETLVQTPDQGDSSAALSHLQAFLKQIFSHDETWTVWYTTIKSSATRTQAYEQAVQQKYSQLRIR